MPQSVYRVTTDQGEYNVTVGEPDAPAQAAAVSPFMRGATEFYEKSPLGAAVNVAKGTADAVGLTGNGFHPLDAAWDAVKGAAKAQWDQAVQAAQKAKEAANGGGALSASEAVGHGLAAILPLIGPAAADVGEHGARGDVAGMVGGALGLLTPFGVKYGLEAAKTGSVVPTAAKIGAANANEADLLRRGANQQVAERVLAPANPKFKGTAQTIAPEVLTRGMKVSSRLELQQLAEEGMAKAGEQIDAVTNQYGAKQPMSAQPVIDALDKRIASMQAGGETIPTAVDRVAALTQLRDYLDRVQAKGGGVVPFDELKKIRDEWYDAAEKSKAYEGGDKKIADVGWAAREGGSAIREYFGTSRPELKAANADYTFFKRLNDVLDPVQGRPKNVVAAPSGVTGGLATAGALIGQAASNIPVIRGAAALVVSKLLPAIKEAQASPGWQLAEASKKIALADALERGQGAKAQAILFQITKMAPRGSTAIATAQPAVPSGQEMSGR